MFAAVVSVLIETYWNVKKILPSKPAAEEVVLIETYWNVKLAPDAVAPDPVWY